MSSVRLYGNPTVDDRTRDGKQANSLQAIYKVRQAVYALMTARAVGSIKIIPVGLIENEVERRERNSRSNFDSPAAEDSQ